MFGKRPKIDTTFGVPMDLNQPFGAPIRDRRNDTLKLPQTAPKLRQERIKLPETAPKPWGKTPENTAKRTVSEAKRPKIPVQFIIGGAIVLWLINPLLLFGLGIGWVVLQMRKNKPKPPGT